MFLNSSDVREIRHDAAVRGSGTTLLETYHDWGIDPYDYYPSATRFSWLHRHWNPARVGHR